MILRRITEHVKAQNWTAIALDFLIVVVGVFIGIQVSNWNDARQDRADEAIVIRSLHEEVVAVQSLSSRILAVRLDLLSSLESAVDVLFGMSPSRPLTERECEAMASSHVFYVGRADLPSLAQLQYSGRSGIISDVRLTDALTALTQSRESMDFVFEHSRSISIDLSRAHADIFKLVPRVVPVANAPGETERDYGAKCDFGKLAANPEALNGLVSNLEYFDAFARDGLIPWTERLGAVHARLDQLLGISHGQSEIN